MKGIDFKINGIKLNWDNHIPLGVEMVDSSRESIPDDNFFWRSRQGSYTLTTTTMNYANTTENLDLWINGWRYWDHRISRLPSFYMYTPTNEYIYFRSYFFKLPASLSKSYNISGSFNYIEFSNKLPDGYAYPNEYPSGTSRYKYFNKNINIITTRLPANDKVQDFCIVSAKELDSNAKDDDPGILYAWIYDSTLYLYFYSIELSTGRCFVPSGNFTEPTITEETSIILHNKGPLRVNGLWDTDYALVKMEDSVPQYLKDYCDFFKGHIKVNNQIQRYYRYGSRPTGSHLTTLNTPGTYYLDVGEKTTEIKNSSNNVLSSFNGRVITLIIQGAGGAGGGGVAEASGSYRNSASGGGGGSGARAWCVLNLNEAVGYRITLTVGKKGYVSNNTVYQAGISSLYFYKNESNASIYCYGGGYGGSGGKYSDGSYVCGKGGNGGSTYTFIPARLQSFIPLYFATSGAKGGDGGYGSKGGGGTAWAATTTQPITITNSRLQFTGNYNGGAGGEGQNNDSLDCGGGGGGASGSANGGAGGHGNNNSAGRNGRDGSLGSGGGGIGTGSYKPPTIYQGPSVAVGERPGDGGDGFIAIYY